MVQHFLVQCFLGWGRCLTEDACLSRSDAAVAVIIDISIGPFLIIADRYTQKLNRLNVSIFTPSLLFSKVAFFLSPGALLVARVNLFRCHLLTI